MNLWAVAQKHFKINPKKHFKINKIVIMKGIYVSLKYNERWVSYYYDYSYNYYFFIYLQTIFFIILMKNEEVRVSDKIVDVKFCWREYEVVDHDDVETWNTLENMDITLLTLLHFWHNIINY